MKILMVLTSHDALGDTGRKTGFWLEEFAAPYYVFTDAGAAISLATPAGGQPPLDPESAEPDAQTDATRRFGKDLAAQRLLADTQPLAHIQASAYDALFYPGGHGPLWDLAENKHSAALIEIFMAAGKPVGAVCHAPAVFRRTRTAEGKPLVGGRRVTGFSNSEETAVQLSEVVPFLLEDELKRLGALYERGPDWQEYVVSDGFLVTGQNPASSAAAARALLALMSESV